VSFDILQGGAIGWITALVAVVLVAVVLIVARCLWR
jgi:hypothetical protein